MLALGQGVLGGVQMIGGLLSSGNRPEKEIPPALRESLALARINVADPNAPGYGQAKAQTELTLSNQLAAAQMQGNPQESIQALASAQQKSMRDLEMYNQQSQQQDYASLQGELGKLQQAQDLQWQLNEFAPYADKSQQSKNMIGGGLQNIFGAGDMYAQLSMINGPKTPFSPPSGVSKSSPFNSYPMSYEEGLHLMNQMQMGSSPTIGSKPTGLIKYDNKPKGLTNTYWKTWR